MAELVISALLPLLFEKLTSSALKNIARNKGIDAEIKKWRRSLIQIQGVLSDAAQKEISSQPVKQWLNDLQHLAYDIDDVLDGLATEAMHREFSRNSESITSKVKKVIPTCCANFSGSTRMHDQLDIITAKLKDLIEEKDALNLSVKEEPKPKDRNRRLQTSMIHASNIVGRLDETKALVHKLLEDEPSDQNFSIVPIVGMGGMGKTTLARLLYDKEQVKKHFELKAWVCVSDDFDSFAISKVIFQAVTGGNEDFADLNLLQVALRDHLKGKRFILVLDDVWSESCEDWETLVGPFHACASGSKVIITTRKDTLLRKLGYSHLNQQLQSLSHDDALSLVAIHALGVNNFGSHLSLKPFGEGIAKKCDGLPLALKALGRLLRTKKDDEEHWNEVLNSEIWKLQDGGGIVPALRLSYHDLSAHLKQLFAYCSLFPKDFMFDKEELVLLWAAEGFLHLSTSIDSTKERLGLEYFDELLSRSFFQHAPNNKSLFVMHDMMNDLATSVASDFFTRLDNEKDTNVRKEILEKYRHMAFVRETYVTYNKLEVFERATSLRTFLVTPVRDEDWWQNFHLSNKVLIDLILKLPLLRVLSLSGFQISEIPESIGTLRHLRYLNLSWTKIICLPETVCNLYNLETLVVFGCLFLAKLPYSFLNLKNMRHLDIRDTPLLDKMPFGIGELKSLQTLSKIMIGGESRFEVTQLKNLKNICGRVEIVGLEKVQNGIHAREANFSQKRLSELDLRWSNVFDGSRNEKLEKEVLNELKPPNDKLIKLKISSYGGLEFPNWVGHPSFVQLKHMWIYHCDTCTSLPPLGQLPLLKELFIGCLNGVKVVGMEVLGSTGCAFPSLEILSFECMNGWKNWSAISAGVVFPCLKQLVIRKCPNLVEVTLDATSSLNMLEIDECDSVVLRKLVQVASAVTDMEITYIFGLNDVVWRSVLSYLKAVEELTISDCDEISYLWESESVASKVLANLRILKVGRCGKLVNLGEREEENNCRSNLLTSLKILEVSYCNEMERCSCPYSIEDLTVKYCNALTNISFSAQQQKLKSLRISCCNKLLEKERGGENITSNMPMLEHLRIDGWPNLKSITKLNYLGNLTRLIITRCKSLESFPNNELPHMTSLNELCIENCPSMDACFPCGVWPPNLQFLIIGRLKKPVSEWDPQNFPTSLVKLDLYGGDDGGSSCSLFSRLLPTSLTSLTIRSFKKLKSVSMGLQHLTSLQRLALYHCLNLNNFSQPQQLTSLHHLYFHGCPNLNKLSHPQHLTSLQSLKFYKCPSMMDLPETMLPSLLHLTICDNLIERCSRSGYYWPLISHIPCVETIPLPSHIAED